MISLDELYMAKELGLMVDAHNDDEFLSKRLFERLEMLFTKTQPSRTQFVLYMDLLEQHIDEETVEQWSCEDYTIYTERFYRRKFRNEIPNNNAITYFFEKFKEENKMQEKENSQAILALYDFNNAELYFDTVEAAELFLNTTDCSPVTLFRKEGLAFVEVDSI